jgi:ABC-type Fe3+-hydroxamate transport system substrate-binding protein
MRDKRAKFVELATKRVNKALDQLRLIGNLSNRAAYDFTEEDGRKIIKALQRELDALRARFVEGGGSSDREFRL